MIMDPSEPAEQLPPALAEIRDEFLALDEGDRLMLLLEFANGLPELPERYRDHPDLLERVLECQSPVYMFVEVDADNIVHLFVTAPREAPTTRGFAAILTEGLRGLSAREVLAIPEGFTRTLGITAAISPLRLRGMSALLGRTKRQVTEKMAS